jgi:hypothetical protein
VVARWLPRSSKPSAGRAERAAVGSTPIHPRLEPPGGHGLREVLYQSDSHPFLPSQLRNMKCPLIRISINGIPKITTIQTVCTLIEKSTTKKSINSLNKNPITIARMTSIILTKAVGNGLTLFTRISLHQKI